VTPYFEVPARHRSRSGEAGGCASAPMGVSPHFLKLQNMGSPPSHTIDAALRNGAWPRSEKASLLCNRERLVIILRGKLNYTTSKADGFWKLLTRPSLRMRMSSCWRAELPVCLPTAGRPTRQARRRLVSKIHSISQEIWGFALLKSTSLRIKFKI
jgi:hypothetical protein